MPCDFHEAIINCKKCKKNYHYHKKGCNAGFFLMFGEREKLIPQTPVLNPQLRNSDKLVLNYTSIFFYLKTFRSSFKAWVQLVQMIGCFLFCIYSSSTKTKLIGTGKEQKAQSSEQWLNTVIKEIRMAFK